MESNALFPFERNRYYVGKLLTSADFLAEQNYFNNKRRFINQLMFGSGIVCGLTVYNLDDLSIMVESGVAVDDIGREIVLENAVVKKLSALEGFYLLTSNHATLCIRYKEVLEQPVYSISAQDHSEEYEKNRVLEGIEFFLMDTKDIPQKTNMDSEFLSRNRMYSDEHYAVDIIIPANTACGTQVRGMVFITKLSAEEVGFSMESTLQTPAFLSKTGEHEVAFQFTDLYLKKGESAKKEFWLLAQVQPTEDTILLAKSGFTKIKVGDSAKHLTDNFIVKLKILQQSPQDIITEEISKINLESRLAAELLDFIPIAAFELQRTKNAYFIESMVSRGVRNYIYTGASWDMRREMEEYFQSPQGANIQKSRDFLLEPAMESREYGEPIYASGMCEISLGVSGKVGDVLFSNEIMHGLGKGNVYVEVGTEYLLEDLRLGRAAKNTIYGDSRLFAGDGLCIPYTKIAVKVMNDRGSFIVAAELLKETEYCLLPLRWVAIKLPSLEDSTLFARMAGKSIDAEQPTAVIRARESHFFHVRFKNMEPCSLIYELTERDSGSISKDGIYTAPAKEGVYEIKISVADFPMISTYAYAIVKRKDIEEQPRNN